MGLRWLVLFACVLGTSCGTPEDTLRCDDLLPAREATFAHVTQLVVNPGPKSCARCHNTQTPLYGLNFEGPGVAYDTLTTKMHLVFPQLRAGEMPRIGSRWTDEDLRVLRTWYCNGAIYDE